MIGYAFIVVGTLMYNDVKKFNIKVFNWVWTIKVQEFKMDNHKVRKESYQKIKENEA